MVENGSEGCVKHSSSVVEDGSEGCVKRSSSVVENGSEGCVKRSSSVVENGSEGCVKRSSNAGSGGSVRKREDYLPWEEYFMAIAFLSAQRSKDPHSQVRHSSLH